MNTVKPVTLTTPDGVNRELRFTLGARKRIQDRFEMSMQDALNKYDAAAFPDILFALMYDAKGAPPADLTIEQLAEMLPQDADATSEIMAAIMSAGTQGKKSKNDLEPLIRAGMAVEVQRQIANLNGSTSGVSEPEFSGSLTSNSGGDTLSAKSTPELSDGSNESVDWNSYSEK